MYRLNKTLLYFLIFTVISSGLAYHIIIKAYADDANIYDFPDYALTRNNHATIIKVTAPKLNEVVKSPLVVKGTARGNWYFEGSFPVRLLDANGNELGSVPAYADGDWMTENFVPFAATLTFTKPTTSTGTLVLQKDNPSGDATKDDSISIPVRF